MTPSSSTDNPSGDQPPSGGIFPLPLEAFEHYMLADDRPDQPMVSLRQVLLTGRLQPEPFERAISIASERHPLLRALVRDPGGRHPRWVDAGDVRPRVHWERIASPLQAYPDQAIDLTSEVGLRLWIHQGPRAAIVTLLFHHACVDGTGAMQFIRDLFAAYGAQTCDADEPWPNLPPPRFDLLRLRGRIPPPLPGDSNRQPRLGQKLLKIARFLARRPSPLACPPDRGGSPEGLNPFPGIVSHTFTAGETDRLKRAAKLAGATLNDLLARDLFLVIRGWTRQQRTGDIDGWMRVAVPINLRTEDLAELPAANVVSYGFLTRRFQDCDEPGGLLDGICRDTREIKSRQSPAMFLKAFGFARRIRGGLRRLTDPRKCYATVVLSNVGDVTPLLARHLPLRDGRLVAGDVVLVGFRGSPPLKPKTRAIFHVTTYCGEMTLAVRTWPGLFGIADSEDLLQRFVTQLTTSMASGQETQSPDLPCAPSAGSRGQQSWEGEAGRS